MSDVTALVGLRIQLKRTVDRPCAICGETTVAIGPGAGQHLASLHCAGCDRHRGWLPKSIAEFLAEMIRLGWPPETIVIRNIPKPITGMGAPAVGNPSAP